MKKITAVLLSLFLTTGIYAFAAPVSQSYSETKAIAAPFIDGIKEAYNSGNYDKMATFFDESMFENFPQSKFTETRKEIFDLYGKLDSVEYIGFINQLDATMVMYKGYFEKTEGLIKVVISTEDNKPVVIGLWFE